MNFTNAEKLLNLCDEKHLSIAEVMLQREIELSNKEQTELLDEMEKTFVVMKNAVRGAIDNPQKSVGGLIGGEAKKLTIHREAGKSVCGSCLSKAIAYAMGTLEVNASMGLIVAAVTAGSSGILPGVLLSIQEEEKIENSRIVMALYNAAAIGYIVSHNATVSGAEGGCQAEVGTASAMAASSLTELMGGTPRQCLSAAGTALTNLMGLICDPIAGLVELPCQSRNGMGAANAIICAETALAGIEQKIPFDEIVAAMKKVGNSMPCEWRETALGGIAATPMAKKIEKQIFNDSVREVQF